MVTGEDTIQNESKQSMAKSDPKSLRPVEVQVATITNAGFRFDRQFILIDDTEVDDAGIAKHLTIKTIPELCLFLQSIDEEEEELTVTYALGDEKDSIGIPLTPSSDALTEMAIFKVDLFGSQAEGQDMGSTFQDFFSRHLRRSVRLLYIGSNGTREVPAPSLIPRKPSKFPWLFKDEVHPQRTRFADAAPFLVTTTTSEQDTRSRLPQEYQSEDVIIRFRTNIHIDTSSGISTSGLEESHSFPPYVEDNWKRISIHPQDSGCVISLDCVFRTPRCQSLNVDFATGKLLPSERQLYRLLTKDRRVNALFPQKPCFGTYCFAEPIGTMVRVGDEVRIEEWQT